MKVAVAYVSLSGNTEAIADVIVEVLKEKKIEFELIDLISIDSAYELVEYDMVFLGMYTWGEGDYPDEVLDLTDEMETMEFNGLPFVLFGSGDSSYDEFCGALDHLDILLKTQGALIAAPPIKVELNPDADDSEFIKKHVEEALEYFYQSARG